MSLGSMLCYVFDDMISALVELLEEKGLITQEEWEKKVKNFESTRNTQIQRYTVFSISPSQVFGEETDRNSSDILNISSKSFSLAQ